MPLRVEVGMRLLLFGGLSWRKVVSQWLCEGLEEGVKHALVV